MSAHVGIVAAAYELGRRWLSLDAVCVAEGVALSDEVRQRLGVEAIADRGDETGSALALRACRQALERAGVAPAAVRAIVDFSVLPQEWLVPTWSMGNRLQHELGATKAFTLGFSGGGAANCLVALRAAAALLRTEPEVDCALLVGADAAIPGNRVLDPAAPLAVLADGATALVLRRDAGGATLLHTELRTDGRHHDACVVPAGGIAAPTDSAGYRLVVDREKLAASAPSSAVAAAHAAALERCALRREDVRAFLCPSQSAQERAAVRAAVRAAPEPARRKPGHLLAGDLAYDLERLIATGGLRAGDHVVLAACGMGFTTGAAVLRCAEAAA